MKPKYTSEMITESTKCVPVQLGLALYFSGSRFLQKNVIKTAAFKLKCPLAPA